jgi:predicted phage baseplate assembly protein
VQSTWEYYAGDKAGWKAISVTSDTTASLTLSGAVTVDGPPDAVLAKMGLLKKPSDPALFWIRFRILGLNGSGYETPPLIQTILLNTITATNAVTESYELLGSANGRPNQTVQLARFPVLPLPSGVKGFIEVDEGDGNGYLPWIQVEDFGASSQEDKVYVLNLSTGLVTFGDGVNGKIPRWLSGNGSNRDDADVPNIRATQYRWGGGARGNAGALQITSLLSSVPYVSSVTNLLPSIGGADEESLAQARERAPMALRTAQRAVTVEDFSFLAIETPGAQIGRAQAFPLLNPTFRFKRPAVGQASAEVPIPGTITVIVVPDSTDPKPTPSAGTLKLVAQWLDGHRLLTTELFVAPPRYRQVSIEAQVIADTKFNNGQVQAALEDKLKAYFHPLTGGITGSGWDFGGTIYFSETYRQILDTAGVLRIEPGTLKTFVDGVQQDSCSDINLEADELVYSTGHTILVSYP